MYWIYFIIFLLAILVPDIVTRDFYFLTENRAQELCIFILGVIGFSIFLVKEKQIAIQEEKQKKSEKKINETAKELVDSYNYIGEVNRKMDILMNITLGLSDRSELNSAKEKEIYTSIIEASNSLMKAKRSHLVFFNSKTGKIDKEFGMNGGKINGTLETQELIDFGNKVNVKKTERCFLACSYKTVNDMRGCLAVFDYNPNQEDSSNNLEILKFLASQAFFLYCYMEKCEEK